MKSSWPLLLTVTFVLLAKLVSGGQVSPYSGQESVKLRRFPKKKSMAIFRETVWAWRKPVKLNHYPGPKHILDLAKQLSLSDEQRIATQAVFDRMKSNAVSLGRQLVEKERLLDSRFAAGAISNDELEQLLAEISAIQGKVRAVHLEAHLAEKLLLTPDQIRRYDTLRGYQEPSDHDQHHGR